MVSFDAEVSAIFKLFSLFFLLFIVLLIYILALLRGLLLSRHVSGVQRALNCDFFTLSVDHNLRIVCMSFLNSIIYKANSGAPSPRTSSLPENQAAKLTPEANKKLNRLKRYDDDTASELSFSGQMAVPSLPEPLTLADFHIDRTLGTGSFGRVHLVQYRITGQYFAMKVLKKSEVVRLKQVEHIQNEKAILEKTQHPLLVNLVGTFQDAINIYMVLEYVQGGEMFTYLRKFQRFPNHIAKFYAAEVVLAFEYMHSKDTIYRDLKPENILLDSRGHTKITDFGFAKYVPDITWTLCGTPDYLAPEIIQSKGYGRAVDWYSLGILIFEMLAGYPPFYDEDHFKLYEKILVGKVRWPQHIDPYAKDLIKRLLTADLTKRYGNLKGGVGDIKRHKWFADIDWKKMRRQEIQPPIVPVVQHEGDTSNFDQYEEINEKYGVEGSDAYGDMFVGF